ncbi:centromere protein L-like [Hetaerina americana]|uniref:centromere protein L-like n=1 Tax=Hetaerina americana TaxID=62018 RepID=UPI003A7F35FC
MSESMPRKKGKIKRSVDSEDDQTSFSNGANAYGVRYGPSVSNISSRRLSRSATRGLASTNATVNLTRRGFSLRLSSAVNQNDENFEGLLHHKWNVYSASAFTCFDTSNDQLKKCSSKLIKLLSLKLHKPESKELYHAELTFSHGFPSVLTVEVFSSCRTKITTRSRNNSQALSQKEVYVAQFFSWDEKKVNIDDSGEMSENSKVFYMPLLLCRSTNGANFIEGVNNCLKALFDMNISKTYLTQEDMSWLISLASSDLDGLSTESSASAQVHFFYDLPRDSLLNCQPHVAISFEVKSVYQLWHCVHQSIGPGSEITYEEVLSFMRCLEEHCLCAYKINLSECCLVKAVIPSASVSLNGMVKITSLIAAGRILRFLADKCAIGNSLVPSLGFSMTL